MALKDETLTCDHCQQATVRFADWNASGWCQCVVPPGSPVRFYCPKERCQQACTEANERGMRGER